MTRPGFPQIPAGPECFHLEHPCGRCGKGEAAGAAGLCAACNSDADEREMIHERAHANAPLPGSDPDTCDRGARCPMSVVPLTAGEAAALLAGDEAAWRAFYAEAQAWASGQRLTPAEIAEEKSIRRGEEEMQDSPRRRS
jgi:hypothetical protein